MAEIVTLKLPETLAQKAKEIAAFTHRRLEDVLLEWIDRAITELPMESTFVLNFLFGTPQRKIK
ncbi:MAG: hypothetical protein V7K57_00450 [Nostoc sp.]